MNEIAIEITDATRQYGKSVKDRFTAVDSVNLQVQKGELFALLGTNGAGKTSLLEMLEGYAPPNSGRVSVLGLDPIGQRRALRPKIGIMLQEAGFPADLATGEIARTWHKSLPHSIGADEALARVGLSDKRHVRIHNLSGGQRRRLDLALAIMGEPELIFLDEPTTGMDPESRHNTWQIVSGLLARGTTIMLTTHYLAEAEELADRVAIMHRGTVRRLGTVPEIVAEHPASIKFVGPTADTAAGHLSAILRDGAQRGWLKNYEVSSGNVRIASDDLNETLYQLLHETRSHRITLENLHAASASLEQVFMSVANEDQGTIAQGVTS